MIQVNDIRKSFSGKTVLKDMSTEFKSGTITAVIGGSGSGKTVFMKCMVGLLEPDSGQVLYDGRDFTAMDYERRKVIRQEIGMLFQYSALFDSMTVEQNVAFPLEMFTDRSKGEIKDRVDFCLERVNLPGVNKRFPDEISGGMKKRVGIARAIALNPRYLFCDEPNSGLDPGTSNLIDNLIKEITVEYNITTIINTHDMNSVLEIGDHIVYLKYGTVFWDGAPDELADSGPEEVRNFVYASNFIREAFLNK